MSTVNAYQRERLVDALTEELGDRDGDRALAERLTDRLVAERGMAVYVLGGIDRDEAMKYFNECYDRANEARAERDEALAALRPLAAAADGFDGYDDDHELAGGWQRVTVEHLRQARTVLNHYEGERA